MKRSAFTLVELLVVAAIVALLLSILLPTLVQARDQAKGVKCLSNFHNMGIALQLYIANSGNSLLEHVSNHNSEESGQEKSWMTTLLKYYGSPVAIRCPRDESRYWNWTNQYDSGGKALYRRSSFATNYILTTGYILSSLDEPMYSALGKPANYSAPWMNYNSIPHPDNTIYIVEKAEGPKPDDPNDPGAALQDHVHAEGWWIDPERFSTQELARERHRGRANYLFLDGHVESLIFKETYDLNEEESDFPDMIFNRNLYYPGLVFGNRR